MKKRRAFLTSAIGIILLTLLLGACANKRSGDPQVLVFSKTKGFRHATIPEGKKAIQKLGWKHGFNVDTTENASSFTEDSLKKYSAVIFLNTTGDVLDYRQQAAFKRYIQAGGGYLGVHAASDTEYHWPWYGKLVGAYFEGHPEVQPADLIIHQDDSFPMLDSLPDLWNHVDEWYNFRQSPEDVNVLMELDESSYQGGTMEDGHPIVWYHNYDGGRSFYLGLGHTKNSYTDSNFLKVLWGGIKYAMGSNEELDYDQVSQLSVPAENRFSKKRLAGDLTEPTELTVLPDRSVLVGERRGGIKYYNSATEEFSTVAHLDVYHEAKSDDINGNVETGLMGLKKDPDYSNNHWIYVYYSPVGKSVDRLSRFKFSSEKFNADSEQIILEVPTRREICCHTGGSIAFDQNGYLYLSTGDNTTPFDEIDPKTGEPYPINTHGYAPLDDRPGFEQYDDARAAGNTNDLRGKILRVNVRKDGSYDIPDGNLFPPGTPKTKPEIYVMGARNPYRISIDQKTGYLYWGDVGPDANIDRMETRGPRGYDEFNQTREAGNFGWPFHIGDNYSYRQYDYETGQSGEAYNPEHPVNDSRNNTGLDTLPPAEPALIWYEYDEAERFPSLGSGGRTAMAGPVYNTENYPEESRFPEYYDGKLFIYEWMRGWVKVVTFDEQHNLQSIEPFMPGSKFVNPMDMEMGPDGHIYEVEYGAGWYTNNPEAGLYVISYNRGNRPPVASFKTEKNAGAVPFRVKLSAEESTDPDGDSLTYLWNFGDGEEKISTQPQVNNTYAKVGEYKVSLTVKDGNGGEAQSHADITAGNERPQVNIKLTNNQNFYFPDLPVTYEIEVKDREDGHSGESDFDTSKIKVKADYFSTSDTENEQLDQQLMPPAHKGREFIKESDCQSCHQLNSESVGPSYQEVAQKYAGKNNAKAHLAEKITEGGSGVWGSAAMPAHPNLSESKVQAIVEYILSRDGDSSMPISGSFIPQEKFDLTGQGPIYLSASYTDKGGKKVKSLTGSAHVLLRNPFLEAVSADDRQNFSEMEVEGQKLSLLNDSEGWLKFEQISLKQIQNMMVKYGAQRASKEGWELQVRIDGPEGNLIGETIIGHDATEGERSSKRLKLTPPSDDSRYDVYITVRKKDQSESSTLGFVGFQLDP